MSDCRFQWRHLVTFSDEAIRGVNFARRNTGLEAKIEIFSLHRNHDAFKAFVLSCPDD
jgi:hypothetical protein